MFNYNPENFFIVDSFNVSSEGNNYAPFLFKNNDNYDPLGTSFDLGINSQGYKDLYYIQRPPINILIESETPKNQEIKNNNEKKNKKRVKPKTKSTDYKTFNKIEITNKKKEIIFSIKKMKKKGRYRKNQIITKKKYKTHTKYDKDNIIIKIKRNLYNHSLELVNTLLKNSNDNKINKIILRKNNNAIIIASKKEKNNDLLEKPIKDILSTKVSSKFTSLHEDYNKDKIDLIIKQNNKEINEFLNKTFKEILDLYRKVKNDNDIYKDFKRLEDDIKKYEMEQDQRYIDLYKEKTENFENIIARIFPRRARKI